MDTYGDMVTLLLTFFIVLYSMSSIEESKWAEIVKAFNKNGKTKVDQIVLVVDGDGDKPAQNTGEDEPDGQGLTDFDEFYTALVEYLEDQEASALAGIPFSVLFGLFLNLKFPKFHWENATEVVKQSAASGLSLVGGFILLLPGMGAMGLPDGYRHLVNTVMILVIAGLSLLFYRKVMGFPLEKLAT